MSLMKPTVSLLLWSLALPLAVHAADPHESFNRGVESFNTALDTHAVKPAAQGYVAVVPDPARAALGNFLSNLGEPVTVVNDLLQGKPGQAVQDTARFIFNSTFGLFGLIDIATPMGLPKHDEDFGQTFAVWGWQDSDYLNLPALGPSTVRDTTGKPLDLLMLSWGWPIVIARVLDTRASLLPVDHLMDAAPDRYVFLRDAYLQRRQFQISDGQASAAKKAFGNFDFDE